jgi:phenylacetate-CoA ligase
VKAAEQLRRAAMYVRARRSERWSAARIRQFREVAMVRMMRHAATAVPFYQRLRIAPESIQSAADIERFPLISKRDIQRDPDALLAAGYAVTALHCSRTSGSSGEPTKTYFDPDSWLLCKYALKARRVAATVGLPLLRRVVIVSEQRPEALADLAVSGPSQLLGLFPRRFVSIHAPMEAHLGDMASFRPAIVYAFPSYFLDLITTAQLRGHSLPHIPHLCTSSEVLSPAHRARIESAFGGRVWDVYGSTEFKEVAWQCGHGRYHINFESVDVETTQLQSGAVVLSTLCNRAMPLLRFQTGDQATFDHEPCPCGRQSGHFSGFAGRVADTITLPSGRRLMPYLLTTDIELEESILQYRIVRTEADAFRIDAVVRQPGQSAAWRERVGAQFLRIAGEPLRVSVREVAALERAPSGKRSVFQELQR